MCIIIIKPSRAEFPSLESVKNSVENNPDGFSLMYNANGVIHVYKTMESEKFVNKYSKLVKKLDKDTTSMVIHCRIATHGTKNVKNTHCWLNDDKTLGFAHNGILSIANRDDMTDSETFFRDLFLPAYEKGGWDLGTLAVKACISSSKFAFLEPNGDIHAFGNYSEFEGCKFSNESYKPKPKPTYVSPYYGSYGYGYGYNKKTYSQPKYPIMDYSVLDWDWDKEYFY